MELRMNVVQQSSSGESAIWGANRIANGVGKSRQDSGGLIGASREEPRSGRLPEETGKPVAFDELQAAVAEIEEELDFVQTRISFQIDTKADETVMRVVDRQTGEVIRQFPPEEFLKIRTAFRDVIRGIFFDKLA
jgi:flagellar protein FlaG